MNKLLIGILLLFCLSLTLTPAFSLDAPSHLYAPWFVCNDESGANACVSLENRGEMEAAYGLSYYDNSGRLVKAIKNLTLKPGEKCVRFVGKDLGLSSAKFQGSLDITVNSESVSGETAQFKYSANAKPCYFPLQGSPKTSLVCNCFNEAEVNGDAANIDDALGEVMTRIALKNPNAFEVKFKYAICDYADGKVLKEGTGAVPAHGVLLFSPRAVLKGDENANLKVRGKAIFEVKKGSLLGCSLVYNSKSVVVAPLSGACGGNQARVETREKSF